VPVLNEVLNERIALYLDLFAGLLLAVFLDRAWDSRVGLARPASVVAAAASLALLLPTIPMTSSDAHVPSIFQPGTSANRYFHSLVPEGSVAVILPANSLETGKGYSMLWQAVDGLRFKMPEGDLVHGDSYGVATLDPAPSPLWWAMSMIQLGTSPALAYAAAVRSQLSQIGTRAVIVGAMPHRDLAIIYFNLLLGRAPVDTGDALIWSTG
jgi:ABC-type proline/glycine betaine transport system permease subunit